jgi:hypothetical protein
MKRIRVAKETVYLGLDGKTYKRGEGVPSGARLLARKGSPIDDTVAEEYGLETEEALDVARVPSPAPRAPEDGGLGVSPLAAEGYARMNATADVMNETAGHIEAAGKAGTSQLRQASLMQAQKVRERVAEATGVNPGATGELEGGTEEARLAAQQPGMAQDEDVTARLERENREAIARSAAPVGKVSDTSGKESKGTASRTRSVGGGSKRAASKRQTASKG